MHLAKLSIANFRCFGPSGTCFEFRPGMNVIIGENNVGKTALVDALRILFSLGPGRRDVYVTLQDLHCSVTGDVAREMRIDAVFEGLSDDEQGSFFELLAATSVGAALEKFSSEQARIVSALFAGSQALSNLLVAHPELRTPGTVDPWELVDRCGSGASSRG